jgi:hypothetical protein
MDRKQVLKTLEERFGVKAKYLGVPSFAYQIEFGGEVFTIDRDGKITDSSGAEMQIESLVNWEQSNEEDPLKEDIGETIEKLEIAVPMEGHTGVTLRNLTNMIYSKQTLIKKAFESDEDIVSDEFVRAINNARILAVDDFKRAIAGIEDYCMGVGFDFGGGTITFKFLIGLPSPEKSEAYTQFVAKLNDSAMKQKYTSDKVTVTDNDRFTFRTWLLRLGFIGDEYKGVRKYLLKNLEGNGAFRRGRRTDEAEAV